MRVIHILKDGSQVEDITGHVVKMEDVNPLYQMIHNINRRIGSAIKTVSNTYEHENEVRV